MNRFSNVLGILPCLNLHIKSECMPKMRAEYAWISLFSKQVKEVGERAREHAIMCSFVHDYRNDWLVVSRSPFLFFCHSLQSCKLNLLDFIRCTSISARKASLLDIWHRSQFKGISFRRAAIFAYSSWRKAKFRIRITGSSSKYRLAFMNK